MNSDKICQTIKNLTVNLEILVTITNTSTNATVQLFNFSKNELTVISIPSTTSFTDMLERRPRRERL